ncbi:hypothetical protein ACLEPN_14920 [Myxococcus sp. 1LA]
MIARALRAEAREDVEATERLAQRQNAKAVLVGRPNSGLPLVYPPDGR